MPLVRKFSYDGDIEVFHDGGGRLESRQSRAMFETEFENSDTLHLEATENYEFLAEPFAVARNVRIPVGSYSFQDVRASYSMGLQRLLSGTVSVSHGEFYDGTLTSAGFSSGRIGLSSRLSLEPGVTINRASLPWGDFSTTLLRTRGDFAFSTRMFASGLVQYSSSDRAFSSNVRFRWEYLPGSEFFAVYTDERDTLPRGFPTLKNRAVVFKINRLLQF
jgi:hypothetical protein